MTYLMYLRQLLPRLAARGNETRLGLSEQGTSNKRLPTVASYFKKDML